MKNTTHFSVFVMSIHPYFSPLFLYYVPVVQNMRFGRWEDTLLVAKMGDERGQAMSDVTSGPVFINCIKGLTNIDREDTC